MKKIIPMISIVILSSALLMSCTNREMNTAGGAALGGVAGYAVTGGSGAGAAIGAVGGGLIGNSIH